MNTTLQECKDQIAKNSGYENWEHLLSKRNYRLEEVDRHINEVVKLCNKSLIEENEKLRKENEEFKAEIKVLREFDER